MTSSSPPLRFAIIGAGLIGPRHARTVVGCDDAELAAIVDPSPAGQALAEELRVAYYASVDDLLGSARGCEAAIICTPNHTHAPIAKKLAANNIHVIIEKPISADVRSARDLVDSLSSTSGKVLVGHHRRFHPCIVQAKRLVDAGALGHVLAVNGIWALHKPLEYFQAPAEWRRTATGGVTLINMIHEVDLLHYLLGPVARVHAEKTMPRRGYSADEGAAMTLRFRSGVVGTFLLSDHAPSPFNFESGTGENPLIPKAGQDFYRIFGTDGCLSVPDLTLWSYRDTEKSWHSELTKQQVPVEPAVPFELQLQHFINCVRGQEDIKSTAESGLAALIVCEAIKQALAEDGTVDLVEYDL